MQKYFVTDYLTKKVVKNHGEREQFFVENNHEGIVPRSVFEQVQAEIKLRADKYSPLKGQQTNSDTAENVKRPDGKYLFTGKITCGVCGQFFAERGQMRVQLTPKPPGFATVMGRWAGRGAFLSVSLKKC